MLSFLHEIARKEIQNDTQILLWNDDILCKMCGRPLKNNEGNLKSDTEA